MFSSMNTDPAMIIAATSVNAVSAVSTPARSYSVVGSGVGAGGAIDGFKLGGGADSVGANDGKCVGLNEGRSVGRGLGAVVGPKVGRDDGSGLGTRVGL